MNINLEYYRYTFIQDLLLKLSTTFLAENYKTKNLIEQWIIELANKEISSDNYMFLEVPKLDLSKENRILSARTYGIPAREFIDTMIYMHKRYYATYKLYIVPTVKPEWKNHGEYMEFSYINYKKNISQERYNILKKISPDLNCMIMRYAVIISSSQHWAIPRYLYKKYIDLFDINYEAFASPLNSQLLMIGGLPKPFFSSLFYDTDKPFGSAGSFFNLQPEFFRGKKVVVNPPFTYELVERSINFCADILKNADSEILFLFSLPIWAKKYTDSKYIIKIIERQECEFEDTNTRDLIKNNTGTIWFIMANYKVKNLDKL